ncbi:MAG: hypothetical protein COC01_10415 [Bacteroidetes bacterium]|nr:MAG: hypothetical protein COC01_10415 [Bacteroidota bacterium]
MYKKRDMYGGRLIMGPLWDFNLAFGNADYCDASLTPGFGTDCGTGPFYWDRLLSDTIYQNLLNCRWNELRKGSLHLDTISDYIDSVASYLDEAKDRNFAKWPVLGNYVWPNYYIGNTYQEEIDYLKSWITNRINWMDTNMPGNDNSCDAKESLQVTITEINYHSDTTNDSGDWFELYNYSSTDVDMSNWIIKDYGGFNSYTIPFGTIIKAGDYLVVCQDTTKFQVQYDTIKNFLGPFNWGLGNGGDDILIFNKYSQPVISTRFDDGNGWPSEPDGGGYTLELSNSDSSLNNFSNWFTGCKGGSPGEEYFPCDTTTSQLIINGDIVIYPNPTNSTISFQYKLISSGNIILKIHDVIGKLVAQSLEESKTAGTYTVTWDASKLKSGLYFYSISSNSDYIYRGKFVKR